MATVEDILKVLIDKTRSGALTWVPTSDNRGSVGYWMSRPINDCQFMLVLASGTLQVNLKGKWRLILEGEKTKPLSDLLAARFGIDELSHDQVLQRALECLTGFGSK